jgi:fructuronate reductase
MSGPRLVAIADVKGTVRLPSYVPKDHGVGIVHIGVGAFHRAQ